MTTRTLSRALAALTLAAIAPLVAACGDDDAETGDAEMVRVDGEWKVTTEQFCSFMATARTPCA